MSDQALQFWTRVQALSKQHMKPQAYDFFIATAKLYRMDKLHAEILVDSDMQVDFWRKQKDVIETAGFEVFGEPVSYQIYSPDTLPKEPVATVPDTRTGNFASSNTPLITGLQTKYTFENFIESLGNRMTLAAAMAVAYQPGKIYNPLFIYGGPGLGKTHLLHAIGNEVLKDNPNSKIKFISSQSFIDEFTTSLRTNKSDEFKAFYRALDFLLIDDIQFIRGEQTVLEFFETFNVLHDKGGQIVLTSDRPPKELDNLEDRLITRFNWGLMSDITSPDYDSRMAILLSKIDNAEFSDVTFEQEALNFIAGHIDSNVRELEGALKRVALFARAGDKIASVAIASAALKDLNQERTTQQLVTVGQVQKAVSEQTGISVEEMISKKRTADIAKARQIAMYLTRELTNDSLPQIGKAFGGKDHTTVMYAYDKIKEMLVTDQHLQKSLDIIKQKLKRGV